MAISQLPRLHRATLPDLAARGITSLAQLSAMSLAELRQIKGIKGRAEAIRAHACAFVRGEPVWYGPLPERVRAGGWLMDIETVMPANAAVWSIGWCDSDGAYTNAVVNAYHDARADLGDGRVIRVVEDADALWDAFAEAVDDGRPVFHWSGFDCGVMERFAPPSARARLTGRMVDLLAVFERTVKLPLRSLSLKKIAPHLIDGMAWAGSPDAFAAFRDYLEWLDSGDSAALAQACRYQYDDVYALWRLWAWLVKGHPGVLPEEG